MIIGPHPMGDIKPPATDRAALGRTAEDLCRSFAATRTGQGSWGSWSRLHDLRAGHPAFVLRRGAEGLGLDTQRWDISGGEACWPTTQILSLSLPWWRRLAERPAQRCLIPVTAACVALSPSGERGGRAAWFTLPGEPLFTVAGLWRDHTGGRCFAMLGCVSGHGAWSSAPMIIASEDRTRWLEGGWDDILALQTAPPAEQIRIGLSDAPIPAYDGRGHAGAWNQRRTMAGR
ncbi:hypothetical protein [Sphingomonas sp.]